MNPREAQTLSRRRAIIALWMCRQFQESLAIAKAIGADPVKRQMWIQRQFELESSEIAADEVLEAAGN